jgi:hypothetical protein
MKMVKKTDSLMVNPMDLHLRYLKGFHFEKHSEKQTVMKMAMLTSFRSENLTVTQMGCYSENQTAKMKVKPMATSLGYYSGCLKGYPMENQTDYYSENQKEMHWDYSTETRSGYSTECCSESLTQTMTDCCSVTHSDSTTAKNSEKRMGCCLEMNSVMQKGYCSAMRLGKPRATKTVMPTEMNSEKPKGMRMGCSMLKIPERYPPPNRQYVQLYHKNIYPQGRMRGLKKSHLSEKHHFYNRLL